MSLSVWAEDRKRKTERKAMVALSAIALFQSVVCTPIHHLLNTNVAFQSGVLPPLWDIVQYFATFSFYWCAFAFFIYVAASYTLRETKKLVLLYGVISFARYCLSWGIGSLMLLEVSLLDDLLEILFEMLVDLLQMGAVALTAYFLFEKGRSDRVQISLCKLVSTSNVFLRGMLIAALIPTILRILSRIRYDIYVGLPQGVGDLLGMIFWYVLDIICAFIGYLVMYWIVSKLLLSDMLAKKERE